MKAHPIKGTPYSHRFKTIRVEPLYSIMVRGRWGGTRKAGSSSYTKVYHTCRKNGHQHTRIMKMYRPRNPRTERQQANRNKFGDGVRAWQALTLGQRQVYNKNASKMALSGYALFMHQFLNNNK